MIFTTNTCGLWSAEFKVIKAKKNRDFIRGKGLLECSSSAAGGQGFQQTLVTFTFLINLIYGDCQNYTSGS